MKLKNTFVQGKMNKDIDERLLPKGQYPHAENIRVSNTDGSDMGAIENVKGNEKLTNLGLTNAVTIGKFADGSNQKIYWFVTSDEKDLVMEYDKANSIASVLLESTNPDGLLGFNRNYLITGVVKIINGDSDKDLLIWTDDLNPPRCINIERAKTYTVDGFDDLDINLVKRPPLYSPTCSPANTASTLENNMENKFYSFAYRYKYLDGEYSALSSFTNYQFFPSEFDLDFQTMENEGMVNSFNAVDIDINTGDKRVTDVEIVFKETNSNTVFLVETFNKENEGWNNDEIQTYRFSNSKVNIALPDSELFRLFDNVPRTAKALELIGTRLVFGNYVEQYDLKNVFGEDINIDYSLTLINNDLEGDVITITRGTNTLANDTITIDLTGQPLQRGNRISITIELENQEYEGLFEETFNFILTSDVNDATELANDPDFIVFVNDIMTATFEAGFEAEEPDDSTVLNVEPFEIVSSTATSITIKAPIVTFQIDNTPTVPDDDDFSQEAAPFVFTDSISGFYKEIAVDSSLKTNRSYEVGIIYLDGYNRATTVLTDEDNTIYIPQEFSTSQNKIVANINHEPPAWADRYKLVIKQNRGDYQTIYTNLFYEDGLFRWVKLEGANVNKVQEGDTLIVKSDLGGVVPDVHKVRVLEVATKERNFITGNENADGDEIIEESGLYMKIKPTNIDMNFSELTARTFQGGSHLRYPTRTFTSGQFGETDDMGVFTPFPLNAGSRVRIRVNFKARGSISYEATYDRNFRVNGNYASVKEWFEAEVGDFGSFGDDYTWNGTSNIGGNINCGFGQAEENNYISGYGFSNGTCGNTDSVKFYVVPHRKGTASRNITSNVKFEILSSDGILIFETEPQDEVSETFFETEETFPIVDNKHLGNIQDQSDTEPTAIVELSAFNCYVQGNGAESYRYKDAFNVGSDDLGNKILANYLNIDLRPTAKSLEQYQEVRRFADLTYSEPYNENTNLNRLNEFNLSKANFKEDIDRKYGFIQHLYSRDTDLVVFQEDKVSRVLYGKDLLLNADGTSNISSIEDVLGQQIPYAGEYGISRNPESFAFNGYNLYFIDSKRGAVCRLGRDGITEISKAGMRTWFRDEFRNSVNSKKLGAFDPHLDQYVVHSSSELLTTPKTITCSDSVNIGNFSGSYTIFMDFGLFIGQGGINFTGNGVPVNYTITWNGNSVETGYLGDASYNNQLNNLGLPNVVGGSTGTLNFDKTDSLPRIVRIDVDAPFCDTDFSISGSCIDREQITVIKIILNDEGDLNRTAKSRFKWSNDTYQSPFATYDSVFDAEEIQLFDSETGEEGSFSIPLNETTIRMESYDGFSQTLEWFEGENRMGYLVSNTLYTEAQIEDIVNNATFLAENTTVSTDGSTTRFIEFDYDRNIGETYLYLIWDYRNEIVAINADTKIFIYFDNSGSMDDSLVPLQTMRDTLLKDRLLPLYDNDETLYDANVTIIEEGNERTMEMLNMQGLTPDGNVIVLVFQDEARVVYHNSSITPRTSSYNADILTLRSRLSSFAENYYRAVIFQVEGDTNDVFRSFIQSIQNGTGDYAGTNGLSDRPEFNYKYNLTDGGTPQYYLDEIVDALEELGYEL